MKFLNILAITLLLSACGFHPQGAMHLTPAMQHLYIKTSDPYGHLTRYLEQTLKMSGVQIASSPQQATVLLDIINEKADQELTGVSGTQQTRQYNFTLQVTYQLTDNKGNILIEPQTISETRTIPIQANQTLGGSNEASSQYQQMRRSITQSILTRLSSKDVTTRLSKLTK